DLGFDKEKEKQAQVEEKVMSEFDKRYADEKEEFEEQQKLMKLAKNPALAILAIMVYYTNLNNNQVIDLKKLVTHFYLDGVGRYKGICEQIIRGLDFTTKYKFPMSQYEIFKRLKNEKLILNFKYPGDLFSKYEQIEINEESTFENLFTELMSKNGISNFREKHLFWFYVVENEGVVIKRKINKSQTKAVKIRPPVIYSDDLIPKFLSDLEKYVAKTEKIEKSFIFEYYHFEIQRRLFSSYFTPQNFQFFKLEFSARVLERTALLYQLKNRFLKQSKNRRYDKQTIKRVEIEFNLLHMLEDYQIKKFKSPAIQESITFDKYKSFSYDVFDPLGVYEEEKEEEKPKTGLGKFEIHGGAEERKKKEEEEEKKKQEEEEKKKQEENKPEIIRKAFVGGGEEFFNPGGEEEAEENQGEEEEGEGESEDQYSDGNEAVKEEEKEPNDEMKQVVKELIDNKSSISKLKDKLIETITWQYSKEILSTTFYNATFISCKEAYFPDSCDIRVSHECVEFLEDDQKFFDFKYEDILKINLIKKRGKTEEKKVFDTDTDILQIAILAHDADQETNLDESIGNIELGGGDKTEKSFLIDAMNIREVYEDILSYMQLILLERTHSYFAKESIFREVVKKKDKEKEKEKEKKKDKEGDEETKSITKKPLEFITEEIKLTNYYKQLEGYRKIYLPVPFDIEDAKDIPNTDERPAIYKLRDEYKMVYQRRRIPFNPAGTSAKQRKALVDVIPTSEKLERFKKEVEKLKKLLDEIKGEEEVSNEEEEEKPKEMEAFDPAKLNIQNFHEFSDNESGSESDKESIEIQKIDEYKPEAEDEVKVEESKLEVPWVQEEEKKEVTEEEKKAEEEKRQKEEEEKKKMDEAKQLQDDAKAALNKALAGIDFDDFDDDDEEEA
ncbi:MAG: hypothetical protein MJ252_22285, partial [archaeon]|nr:hypothetical protein [archaeon]